MLKTFNSEKQMSIMCDSFFVGFCGENLAIYRVGPDG